MSKLFDLTGKFAFITGSTKGIGRSIAEAFVDHGATVALTSRTASEAEAAAAEINARVGREAAIGLQSDMADRVGTIAAYESAVARFGHVDILVANAAATTPGFGPAASTPPEEYSRLLDINVVNNAALINHASAAMKERRDGVILVTSSGSGMRPSYGVLPYGVSKAALSHFVRCLGAELAPFNVRVNAIAPGATRSWSMEQSMRDHPEAHAKILASVPLRRIIEPEEIAAGMVFLASEGGKAMTGQTILMDGGEPGRGAPHDA